MFSKCQIQNDACVSLMTILKEQTGKSPSASLLTVYHDWNRMSSVHEFWT